MQHTKGTPALVKPRVSLFGAVALVTTVAGCEVPQRHIHHAPATVVEENRPRARDLGIRIGRFATGPDNAITDVAGVLVGHATVIEGDTVRTGVTVVLPHGGNLFRHKVPAAIDVANGFGKLTGSVQVAELGTIESPIALTNTLSVARVTDALIGHMLLLPGNENVRSINVVVGETNDGGLSDIRGRHVNAEHVAAALRSARTGPVPEGCVGAGTGTRCLGYKGGIGTSSRRVDGLTVGVLVQSNFGGTLRIDGQRLPPTQPTDAGEDGSCAIVIATDANLGPNDLRRLARRSFVGMARVGASFSHGSGDFAIAFATRQGPDRAIDSRVLSQLFAAVADATEEAILNSLLRATSTRTRFGSAQAIPVDRLPHPPARDPRAADSR